MQRTSFRRPALAKLSRPALAAGLAVAVAAGCLSEDDPGSSGGVSVGTDPSPTSGPTVPAWNPQAPTGLFADYGIYLYIWPSGRFVLGRPVRNSDGEFDEAATIDRYRTDFIGQIVSSVKQGSRYAQQLLFDDGSKDTGYSNVSGGLIWPYWLAGFYNANGTYSQVRPVGRTSMSGVYEHVWNGGASADPGAGQTGVNIYTGGYTVFKFKESNRVYFKNASFVSTSTVVGTTGGGTQGTNRGNTNFDHTNVEGEGSYAIDGHYMTITFDNGDALTDIFYMRGSAILFGNAIGYKK